ncbi:tRNA (adenine(22)-N(1))-methyltransferase [Fervidibacillus halotolerans]|uniref:tRNA (Adenine(22)-N(1))-methyltransferase TrmK n=1 Tax=Fervidibacillus halotolerans TaxID=2980027 RepID=A0A9E8LXZ6_9BACI|nr:tRNA (adenine(22)-N(1))-methyltransferase TrmK [Fervidibacillus halotolerans]WAA11482.1 tRNA (adenine(22)-N(1))-methyltransferase TrmK [Fervidibacillus halotolerans]
MIEISERLKTIALLIPKNSILADIGSDHAYLPIYALSKGIIRYAISGEVAEGPYQSALSNVNRYGLQEKISVRKGDGLTVIQPEDHVNCVVIAGMGGGLIENILKSGRKHLDGVQRLILQPNIHAYIVRKWLFENYWRITDEKIMEEDGHIYELLIAEKGNWDLPEEGREKQLFFGPFLLKEHSPIFQKKWEREKNEWINILNNLQHAKTADGIEQKRRKLATYLQWYEEVFDGENS